MRAYGLRLRQDCEDIGPQSFAKLRNGSRRKERRMLARQARQDAKREIDDALEEMIVIKREAEHEEYLRREIEIIDQMEAEDRIMEDFDDNMDYLYDDDPEEEDASDDDLGLLGAMDDDFDFDRI